MSQNSVSLKVWPWLIVILYPLAFGAFIISKTDPRPFLLSGQAIELYALIIVLGRVTWIALSDAKAKITAPFSYIKVAIISLPIVLFVIVLGVLVGFGIRWATMR